MPGSASSSSRRSSVVSSSTRLPSTMRGCGSNVTTVGVRPALERRSITRRCPRCTPSKVPSATARGRGSELARRRARPSSRAGRERLRPGGRATPAPRSASSTGTARPPSAAASRSARRARPRSRARTSPELTSRSRPGDAPVVRRAASSACTVERRSGISTVDAAPVQLVGALAADLDRRGGRDRQLDLAAEPVEPRSSSRRRRLVRVETSPSGSPVVVTRREVDVRQVALVEPDEALRRASSRARAARAAARWRTGRACRRGPPARRSGAAASRDDRERRGPGRLVDEDEAGWAERARRRHSRRGELAADEVRDLLDRRVAREAGGLPVAAAARLARDRGHVELVDRRAQADLARRRVASRGGSRISAAISAPSIARRESMIPSAYGSAAPSSAKSLAQEVRDTSRPPSRPAPARAPARAA